MWQICEIACKRSYLMNASIILISLVVSPSFQQLKKGGFITIFSKKVKKKKAYIDTLSFHELFS